MSFIHLILNWYQNSKRELPWRESKNPYSVWLSEIILQQTRVKQGTAYYVKFLDKYPVIKDLAKADEQEVLNLWQGLGYYTRARNLHKTAQIISSEMGGKFPKNFTDLKKLPGIGKYTAAAIASICFDEKVPAIDGNAYRVYSRYFGLSKDISDSNAHKYFFQYALDIMPETQTGDFNQAIMELGATVCLPQSPLCMFCPVQINCVAYNTGKIAELPVKSRKVKVQKKYINYFFIHYKNQFLVKKRTSKGVWQNMYDFPQGERSAIEDSLQDYQKYKPSYQYSVKHILTHRQLHLTFYSIKVNPIEFEELSMGFKIINQDQIGAFPFPKPINDYLLYHF